MSTPSVVIVTHGDVDGVCAAAIAKTSYPKAKVEFAAPYELASKLGSLLEHDRAIILDLGINDAQKMETVKAFRKLSKTCDITYIDHHLFPHGVTRRSLACDAVHKTNVSASELAWEFFKPPPSHDFIVLLGAIGDHQENTPRMQKLISKHGAREAYSEALLLERTLTVGGNGFKRLVVEELARGKWLHEMPFMTEQICKAVIQRKIIETHVRDEAENISEHVMLVRNVPFKATGLAADLLIMFTDVDVGIGTCQHGGYVPLSTRRRRGSDINLSALLMETTPKLGGAGGGHEAAAGGIIPVQRFDEFLKEVKRRIA